MKYYSQAIVFLVIIAMLASLYACSGDQASNDGSTAPESAQQTQTQEEISSEETTAEPYVKQTFDENEVYAHVFERHSRKLTAQEAASPDIDTAAGQMIIGFSYQGFDSDDIDYYLVEHASTNTHGYNRKYQVGCNEISSSSGIFRGYVTDDYHEAYLDVMLAHLTFAECESIPTFEDHVYNIGWIKCQEKSYDVRADGHIYYTEDDVNYCSQQTVDAAYLMAIILISEKNESNAKNSEIQVHMNYHFVVEGEKHTFTKGELLVDADGNAYEFSGEHYMGILRVDGGLDSGMIKIWCNWTNVYPNAFENSNLK